LFILGLAIGLFYKCKDHSTPRLGHLPILKDNPINPEIAALGKKLFFDKRLSVDNSIACVNCHMPKMAFTDGKKLSNGVHGKFSMRNAPTLFNVVYQKTLMADGQVPSLEMQALVPLRDTLEMGNDMKTLISKLKSIDYYNKASQKLFKRDFDAFVLTQSLANFQRTLISDNSPFDRYYFDHEENAISQQAKDGWKIFSEELYCTKCHTPPLFTNLKVENNGLYKDYSTIADKGRFRINGDSTEIGSFKVPTLRNISLTAPYMHDGSFQSINQVLEFYSKGGNKHKNQNSVIQPFDLNQYKKNALLEFLNSLEEIN